VVLKEQCGILQNHGATWHHSTPRSSVASFNTMEQRSILQHHGAVWHPSIPWSSVASNVVLKNVTLFVGLEVLKDTTLRLIVEVCHFAPCCWSMPRCSLVLKEATMLRGVEGCQAALWC
jgi:hypothetical protein